MLILKVNFCSKWIDYKQCENLKDVCKVINRLTEDIDYVILFVYPPPTAREILKYYKNQEGNDFKVVFIEKKGKQKEHSSPDYIIKETFLNYILNEEASSSFDDDFDIYSQLISDEHYELAERYRKRLFSGIISDVLLRIICVYYGSGYDSLEQLISIFARMLNKKYIAILIIDEGKIREIREDIDKITQEHELSKKYDVKTKKGRDEAIDEAMKTGMSEYSKEIKENYEIEKKDKSIEDDISKDE